jgi:penicillin-binding protein 1A
MSEIMKPYQKYYMTQEINFPVTNSKEITVTRKIKEIVLALKLDAQVSKDMILQIYLNESPYGGTM